MFLSCLLPIGVPCGRLSACFRRVFFMDKAGIMESPSSLAIYNFCIIIVWGTWLV